MVVVVVVVVFLLFVEVERGGLIIINYIFIFMNIKENDDEKSKSINFDAVRCFSRDGSWCAVPRIN